MPRLSIFILMLAISSLGAAQEQTAPRDTYMPLFLMYSGDPSPERLQALRQFLNANNTPKEVIKDTLETVIYKLKTFKTGFAYPVYFSETAISGNACVVADSHHSHVSTHRAHDEPTHFKICVDESPARHEFVSLARQCARA
jgi:hypothetical protein